MRPRLVAILVVLLLLPSIVLGQAGIFGKNKVQYKKFDYYYIQSDHFDVYFTSDGEYLAEFTADVAESALVSISRNFHYQITNRIPIIVYNSHNDFQQTNAVQEYLEEGIGGVTELFKNRIILPFDGSYRQFRHVIHHELVHAVINDMFYGGSIQSIITNNIRLQLPLWFNEGLAEYEALRWDSNSDMFMRDAIITGRLPVIDYLNGYYAYRGGQSVWWYIANKYGEQKIGEILNRIRGTKSVDQGFRSTIGLSVQELSDRWQKEQKVLYWPDIAKREDPAIFARRLTNHVKERNFYNSSPAISPQGDRIAFISDRDDYFDVFLMSALDGQVLKKLVSGQRTKDFEELHLLTPGISWSPDGKRIALAAKSGEQDAIFLINVEDGDREKLELGLDGIFSVEWSPSGEKIAFVGLRDKQSDVYAYDIPSKMLKNLTDDIFSDIGPYFGRDLAWSADGKVVYFVSDRGEYTVHPPLVAAGKDGGLSSVQLPKNFKMQNYNYSQLDIYSINVETQEMKRITNDPNSDETSPVVSPDGKKLLFISDRNGITNIYEKDLTTGKERPITNSLNGIYQLSLTQDGNKLVFSSMVEGGFDLFLLKTPFERNLNIAELEPTEYIRRKQAAAQGPPLLAKDESAARVDSVADVSTTRSTPDSVNLYGENIRIDLRSHVFAEKLPQDTSFDARRRDIFRIAGNVDEQGNYKVNKYKISFSPDIVYGNAGYSTFYGVQGTTQMAFSDMLGNHQIYFLTNLLLDLKNSDYALAYYNLASRIDWGIEAYHSARFLYLELDEFFVTSLYRFRQYGVNLYGSRPFDKFNRLDFGISWFNLTRDNLDFSFIPSEQRTVVMPGVSLVHDNVLWGAIAPVNGSRYEVSFTASRRLAEDFLSFTTLVGDYRRYFRLGKEYVFAFRTAGGASYGKNAQRFIIGGTEGWINREFENDRIPINDVQDYAFLTPVVPLRGYNYNARAGTKYGLVNLEMRYPLLKYLLTGPLPLALQNISGVAFVDVGAAWKETAKFRATTRNASGEIVPQDLLIGTGFGARLYLLYFLLRLDIAWQYNYHGFSEPKYYFSLGLDY
jgi:Tol biopolymer transport system component